MTVNKDEDGKILSETYNDETLFEFSFVERFTREGNTSYGTIQNNTINALACKDVIEKYVTNEYAKEQILNEFSTNSNFLCPDTPSIVLYQ